MGPGSRSGFPKSGSVDLYRTVTTRELTGSAVFSLTRSLPTRTLTETLSQGTQFGRRVPSDTTRVEGLPGEFEKNRFTMVVETVPIPTSSQVTGDETQPRTPADLLVDPVSGHWSYPVSCHVPRPRY